MNKNEAIKLAEATPLYTHDCEGCTYLGQFDASEEQGWGMVDLYICAQGGLGYTVIARYGNDGPQYGSGMTFARQSGKYAEAIRRALALECIKDGKEREKAEKILDEFDNSRVRVILDTSDFGDSHFQNFLSENEIEANKVNDDIYTIEYVADRPTIENMIDKFWATDKEEGEYLKAFIIEVVRS